MSRIDDCLATLAEEWRERFAALLAAESGTRPALHAEIDRYLAVLRRLGAALPNLDVAPGERLAARFHALLDTPGDAEVERLVCGAARYFVTEADDDEVTGVLAFDDDTAVLAAVCRTLGRPDLLP